MSKGSSPRPFSVSQDEFSKNFDLIFRKDKRKEEEQQLEDEEFNRIAKQKETRDSKQSG